MRAPGRDDDDPGGRPADLDDPAARDRLGRASAQLLAVVLASVSGLGMLLLWHLARRGRVIRHRLGDPRPIRWPEDADEPDPTGPRNPE